MDAVEGPREDEEVVGGDLGVHGGGLAGGGREEFVEDQRAGFGGGEQGEDGPVCTWLRSGMRVGVGRDVMEHTGWSGSAWEVDEKRYEHCDPANQLHAQWLCGFMYVAIPRTGSQMFTGSPLLPNSAVDNLWNVSLTMLSKSVFQ